MSAKNLLNTNLQRKNGQISMKTEEGQTAQMNDIGNNKVTYERTELDSQRQPTATGTNPHHQQSNGAEKRHNCEQQRQINRR